MLACCAHVANDPDPERAGRAPSQAQARAAHEGKSLSDYLLDEMARLAELPTIDEWVERLHSRAPVRLTRSTAEWVREDRDSR